MSGPPTPIKLRMCTSVPPPGHVSPRGPSADTPREPGPAGTAPRGSRRRPRSRLLAGALGALAIAGVVFLLFGLTSSQLADPIAQAATISSTTPGYKIHMTINMTSPALVQPITVTAYGTVDRRDDAASMSMAMDFSQLPQVAQVLGSATMRMGMIMDGSAIYVQLPAALVARNPSLGGKTWFKMDLTKLAGIPGLSSLTNNPTIDATQTLRYLHGAADSVTNEGRQLVDGVETTHYRADLRLDRLSNDLPASDQGPVHQALSNLEHVAGIHELPVDVWIDGHHLVRGMDMSLDLHVPRGPVMHETVSATITDYGPQPRPTPPPADQVQDISGLAAGQPG